MGSPATQFRCLELIPVHWVTDDKPYCECAVLHEIGAGCGLFQVDRAAAPGTQLRLTLPHGEIAAVVQDCTPEEGGYILRVSVACAEEWLDGRYRPSVLIPLHEDPGMELPLAS